VDTGRDDGPLIHLKLPLLKLRQTGLDALRREGAPVMEDPEDDTRLCPDCDGTGVFRPPQDQLPGTMSPPEVPCPM